MLLALWTVLYPHSWVREVVAYDEYGREAESIGFCDYQKVYEFVVPILLINGMAMVLALWQAFKARSIETDFSESKYIAIAVASIWQAL